MEAEFAMEYMREKLVCDGKSGQSLGDVKNLVQYMEAEELIETFQKHYPGEFEKLGSDLAQIVFPS